MFKKKGSKWRLSEEGKGINVKEKCEDVQEEPYKSHDDSFTHYVTGGYVFSLW